MERASPSPRGSTAAGNGWGEGASGGGGRTPRAKPSARLSQPAVESEDQGLFTEGSLPRPGRRPNELSESEAAALAGSGQRPAHLYAGPSDRSQATAGYLRGQGFSFPTMLAGGASPGQSQLLQSAPRVGGCGGGACGGDWHLPGWPHYCGTAAALLPGGVAPGQCLTLLLPCITPLPCPLQYVPPLSLDGRSASGQLPAGLPAVSTPKSAAGALGGGGSGAQLQPPGQLVVGSYPAAITAQAPPAMAAITTADAMATEGRIIEDAAMHEQYVRVITPEPAPTEETEEVGWRGWRRRPVAVEGNGGVGRRQNWRAGGRAGCWGGGENASCSHADLCCTLARLPVGLPALLAHFVGLVRAAFPPPPQVCYLLRQSLDMRAKWLFRPQHSPEQLAHLPEAVTISDLGGGDPFDWRPQVPWGGELRGCLFWGKQQGPAAACAASCRRTTAAAHLPLLPCQPSRRTPHRRPRRRCCRASLR